MVIDSLGYYVYKLYLTIKSLNKHNLNQITIDNWKEVSESICFNQVKSTVLFQTGWHMNIIFFG